jgi:hypothetical protein
MHTAADRSLTLSVDGDGQITGLTHRRLASHVIPITRARGTSIYSYIAFRSLADCAHVASSMPRREGDPQYAACRASDC